MNQCLISTFYQYTMGLRQIKVSSVFFFFLKVYITVHISEIIPYSVAVLGAIQRMNNAETIAAESQERCTDHSHMAWVKDGALFFSPSPTDAFQPKAAHR